jgi:hypothetical protein
VSDVERDEVIARVAREVRHPVAVSPGLDARIMAAVRAERARSAAPATQRAWRWLVRPRMVALSPLTGLAMAAGVAGMVLLLDRDGARPAPATVVAAAEPVADARFVSDVPVRDVQFVLFAPQARQVAVVGDFNDWDPKAPSASMRVSATGVWSARLPVTLGRHEYAFVVDGKEWTLDPRAPSAADDFGKPNSVLTVGESAP